MGICFPRQYLISWNSHLDYNTERELRIVFARYVYLFIVNGYMLIVLVLNEEQFP